ncbi:endo-1,4-beta-xylanase [Algoriphagus boritolerans]|uniref:Beta-xylanase n=1 Tax=Algoriphagus boritolerans DSM 17298 = JCM 18970 TaxID=1120964 RepID=A0A1H5ZP63_9BACT|nr:endo-1,4-beta-xylanase [Algoriphagus boritolerans]SEG37457.1 endo-1,4-beta-xylanase [Algoriphagus boritolerans DSM 17298 = JCM 18970]
MRKYSLLFLAFPLFLACKSQESTGLKNHFNDSFYIGAALNLGQVTGKELGADSLLNLHFSSISPENGLKWGPVHPKEGEYNFEFGDAYVALGEKIGSFTIGHTLVWHQQTPAWVFQNGEGQFLNQADLIKRMEDHISTVVGRYKGKIDGWDVVNEAFEDDGTWRKTHWYTITGSEFIKAAFRKANEADPDVALYYNDYNVWKPEKRKAILDLATELRAEGIRIDGIGMQGHYRLNSPSLDQIEQAILDIHAAGFEVHVTELDVDVLPRPSDSDGADLNINYAESDEWNPYKNGLPAEVEKQLIDRYVSIFQLFRKHQDKITRVTFWGLHDGRSWLNNWPVRGRTNYALLFDREMKLKPGFLEAIAN